ncbi:MAG: sugar transferase [Eubacterium sp.]|nr:sugar transferase [Eubacterium sp.]
MKKWENLPHDLQCDEVRKYYDILKRKKLSIALKRIFDFIVALVFLILCVVPMAVISLIIAAESKGGIFYRQERVTTYGKVFKIHKFRTMVANADKKGTLVTVDGDSRITKSGQFLRKYRLDELPQLIDVLEGNMSFVGTRPEVPKYVDAYSNEMKATLLLPAGITSEASIRFKDEAEMLSNVQDADEVYVNKVLPSKMKYNLVSIKNFSFFSDVLTMFRTVFAVFGKEYKSYFGEEEKETVYAE